MFRLRDDDGIAMVFVAILLVMLVGMVAFAVDTAALYQERRSLQNGADAAVLAIAEDCALETAACDTATATDTADAYADANVGDSTAQIDSVELDTSAQTVEVVTATQNADGTGIFRPFFAQVIGFEGAHVQARASAAWGGAASASVLPIIISDCEWNGYTLEDGTVRPPVHVYTKYELDVAGIDANNSTAAEWEDVFGPPIVFTFHDGKTTEECNANPGHDTDGDGVLAGGFGWLDGESGCSAYIVDDQWAFEDPGASPTTGCSPEALEAIVNTVQLLPYFSDVSGLGANGQYEIADFGAFFIQGYNFGGQYKYPSAQDAPCSGDERCLAGWATVKTSHSGTIGGSGGRGVMIIQLTG